MLHSRVEGRPRPLGTTPAVVPAVEIAYRFLGQGPLRGRPSSNVGEGGAAVLEWARSGADLKGFATFHGGLKTPEGQNYSKARGKILIMHGTADSAITMDQFAGLANELEGAGIDHEMITYGGAQHAFTVLGGSRYQEAADIKSWKRFTEFLVDTLKK